MKCRLNILVLAAMCQVFSVAAKAQPADVIALLESGAWGWEDGESTCQLNPQEFSFSLDGSSVTITWANKHDPAKYQIERTTANGFIAELLGEVRLTDQGDPVRW